MPKKKRILFTIPNFKTAGSQYVVLALIQNIDTTRYIPYVAVERFPENIPQWIPNEQRIVTNRTQSLWRDTASFSKLLKKHQIDLVHSWDYKSESIEAIGCKRAGVPYLFTKKNDAWSKRWFLKSILATHIAYDNPDMKQRFFSSRWFKHKITFIPHGVNTTVFQPSSKKRTIKDDFHICTVGNIGANKNQLFLIKALRKLPETIKVNLYGKADTKYLSVIKEAIATYKLEKRVQFHGFIANEELPKILQKQDVFVLPSKREGLPVSVLEALACGVPSLCSDSGGGARFIFGDRADEHIFEIDNQQDFMSKLKPLIEDVSYYSEKQKQAIAIAKEFDVVKETSAYAHLYKKLL